MGVRRDDADDANSGVEARSVAREPRRTDVTCRAVHQVGPGVRLCLLAGFRLSLGTEPLLLPLTAQRVLALLALQDRPVLRSFVAASLWLEATDANAAANLRSALWRLGRAGRPLVEAVGRHLQLASDVAVDLRQAVAVAHRAMAGAAGWQPTGDHVALLSKDLLPTWYDEWAIVERERFRLLRLHALEALCERLTDLGRFGDAVQAGFAAVAADPLRETARRVLIRAFLAEGNVGEAVRQYGEFRALLRDELGLEPSPAMTSLVPVRAR